MSQLVRLMTITVPGSCVPKGRPRVTRGGGRTYTPERTAAFEASVRAHALASRGRAPWPMSARYGVEIVVYADRKRRDLDNCAKTVLDGLIGVLYDDDAQVDDLRVHRVRDSANPRTTIAVRVLGG